jgi:hypothetical protein
MSVIEVNQLAKVFKIPKKDPGIGSRANPGKLQYPCPLEREFFLWIDLPASWKMVLHHALHALAPA